MPLSVPETRYDRSGDVNIAYQVFGEGDMPLVWIPGFVQHLELNWEEPHRRAWFEGLGVRRGRSWGSARLEHHQGPGRGAQAWSSRTAAPPS